MDEKDIIRKCHAILDAAGVPPAAGAPCNDKECFSHLTHRTHQIVEDRDKVLLRVCQMERVARNLADTLYETGKILRAAGDERGKPLMYIATNAHRECQIIKGEEPLPAAGEKLTEKRKDEDLEREEALLVSKKVICPCGSPGCMKLFDHRVDGSSGWVG